MASSFRKFRLARYGFREDSMISAIVAAGINAESTDTAKYHVESVRQNAFSFSNRRETKDKTIPSPHEIKRNLTNIVEIIYPDLLYPSHTA